MATSSKNHYQYLLFDIYFDEYSEYAAEFGQTETINFMILIRG